MKMKKTMTNLGLILFASFTLFNCGSSNTKQKELELREREIAIKEKELGIMSEYQVDTSIKKSNDASAEIKAEELRINLQPGGGAQGQVTFLLKGQTAFYFEEKITEKGVVYGKGKIIINGTTYKLNNLSFNSKNGSYIITGDQIFIKTSACIYEETESEDCTYGTFSTVTITLKDVTTILNNIDLQDCPSFN